MSIFASRNVAALSSIPIPAVPWANPAPISPKAAVAVVVVDVRNSIEAEAATTEAVVEASSSATPPTSEAPAAAPVSTSAATSTPVSASVATTVSPRGHPRVRLREQASAGCCWSEVTYRVSGLGRARPVQQRRRARRRALHPSLTAESSASFVGLRFAMSFAG